MKNYLSLVKFSHTIFALPFAMLGFFLGVNRPDAAFTWKTFFLVLLCMVFARSAAMAFNRYLDREIDKKNPRTASREIPAGIISAQSALLFVAFNSLLFIITTWFINPLCFYLSPIALAVVLGYSYTKRFTWLCHFVLGLGLSFAPVGAYLAVSASFDLLPVLYAGAVLFWVAGFDIIYALQDDEFDQSNNLHSVPAFLGRKRALGLSSASHFISTIFILLAGWLLQSEYSQMAYFHWIGTLVFLSLLFYQHTLVKTDDLSRVNLAFFTTNGVASLIFGSMVILDFYI